jgi:ubiquinone/menaquinone biosynthesis C-methylase UbiE
MSAEFDRLSGLPASGASETAPDLARALAHYAQIAQRYDRETEKIQGMRRKAVRALQLKPGQTVLDVGCGTGACLAWMAQSVGPSGQVIGIEPSPDLLAHARARVARLRLDNVALLDTTASRAKLDAGADAALFCFTHDVLQPADALENIFNQCTPGARIVATGTQYLPKWAWPVPGIQRFTHRHYITARDTLDRPYRVLEAYLELFSARRVFPWHSYLARGVLRKAPH